MVEDTEVFDEDDLIQIEEQSNNPPQLPTPQGFDLSIPLATLVENTFKEHFQENGRRVIDTLSKVDPATYIKQITSIIPKQIAVKGNAEVTHEIKGLTRDIIDSIDELTGRGRLIERQIPAFKEEIEEAQIVEDEEDWLK